MGVALLLMQVTDAAADSDYFKRMSLNGCILMLLLLLDLGSATCIDADC